MGDLRSGLVAASLGWTVTIAIGALSVALVLSQVPYRESVIQED